MAQQIKQEVLVDVTVKGGDAAAKTLTDIDAKVSSIKQNARGLSSALGSLNKVNGVTKINQGMKQVSSTMAKTTQQSQKLQTIWKNMDGSKIVPMASIKTPKTGTMTNMSSAVQSTSMKDPSQYTKVATATKKAGNEATTASAKFGKLTTALNKSSKSAKSASWNFFRTRAAVAAVAAVVGVLGAGISKWFALSSDYAEASHLFYTTLASSLNDVADAEKTASIAGKDLFGNLTGDSVRVTPAVAAAADEVERMASAMMLDSTQLKRTYATFYEMANSAGMATDKVMKLSQGMTQLSYDLSSLWDKPFDETASKLQSGISGISTAVKSYGIDISRTAADAWLLANGFDAQYISLTRANKMIVMYNMLMEHTTTAQGDLARSALQPANMFRILGEQVNIAGRMMGAAIFPVVTKLIPLFIMLAQAIQRAAASLSAFLGVKLGSWYKESQAQWNSYLSNLNKSFSGGFSMGGDEAEEELEGVGDTASDTAKALKEITDFTLPFDELHMLPKVADTGAGGGGGGSGAGIGGADLDIPILDPYAWDDDLNEIILSDAQKTLDTLKALIDNTFGTGTVDAFKAAIDSMGQSAMANFSMLSAAVGNLVTAFLQLINWPEFLRGFADGFNAVTTAVTTLASWIAGLAASFLQLEPIRQFFQDNSYNIGKFLGILAGSAAIVGGFNLVMKVLGVLAKPIAGFFSLALAPLRGFATLLGRLSGVIPTVTGLFKGFSTTLGRVLGTAGGGGLRGIVGVLGGLSGPVMAVIAVIAALAGAFAHLMSTDEEFRNGVTETWNRITASFALVGEAIQPFIDQLTEALQRIAGAFGLVIDPATGLWDTIAQMLQPALEFLIAVFENLVYFLEGAFVLAFGVVTGVISTVSYIFEAFGNVVGGVFEWFKGLGEFLTGVFTGDLTKVSEGFATMSSAAGSIVEGLVGMVTGLFKGLGDIVVNILSVMGIDVRGIWDGIKGGIDSVVRGISSFVTSSFQTLSGVISCIFEGIKGFMTNPIETAKNVISGIVNTLKGIFNFEWKMPQIKLPHFKFTTRTFLGIQIPMFSGIEWYAKGGIFDGPTVAGIGEAGPEAVVPLQGARMKPFAEAVGENINNVNNGATGVGGGLNGDALIAAMSTAVYNAMITGFPKEITTSVNLDGVKVDKELKNVARQQNAGTSLVGVG